MDYDPELLWAAGLFVGEGSIWTTGRGTLSFGLTMLDERAVLRFVSALSPLMPPRIGPWHAAKPPISVTTDRTKFTRIHLGGRRAYAAAEILLPHIRGTDKGDQVEAALLRHPDLASPTRYDLVWERRRAKFGANGFSEEGTAAIRAPRK